MAPGPAGTKRINSVHGARRPAPNIILGPVLYFRGEQGDRWWLSALFVLDGDAEPYDLRVDGVTCPFRPATSPNGAIGMSGGSISPFRAAPAMSRPPMASPTGPRRGTPGR